MEFISPEVRYTSYSTHKLLFLSDRNDVKSACKPTLPPPNTIALFVESNEVETVPVVSQSTYPEIVILLVSLVNVVPKFVHETMEVALYGFSIILPLTTLLLNAKFVAPLISAEYVPGFAMYTFEIV